VKFSRVRTPQENGSGSLQRLAKIDNNQTRTAPINRARKHLLLFPALPCVILVFTVAMNAQLTTAVVVGTVTDSTGAVLPNATVTLTNQRTAETRQTQSNSSGQYTFTFLLPGSYSLKLEAPGFTTFTSSVLVSAGDRARVDAPMQVGQSSESVEVTSQSPLLQTENSTVENTVPEQHVEICLSIRAI
jgi:hypothetical protein